MAEETESTSVVDALKDVLSESSETLTTYTAESKADNVATEQYVAPSAVLRTPENDPNYKVWQEAFERTGDENVLVKTDLTPETISAAASLLVHSPEFKDYIGQYALSNDINKNLEVINDAINSQKQYNEDMSKEVDGDFFKSKDAYFIQRIISGINQTGKADDFFKELRDKVNAEFTPKEEADKPAFASSSDKEPDALQKVAQLLEQREGELVEDVTPGEAWDEFQRMLKTPEYKDSRIEELGYDPEVGHPDPEIREYLKAQAEWAKQSWKDQGPEPTKPENYEQRLKQPKTDYDNKTKQQTEALTPEATKPLSFIETTEPTSSEQTISLFNTPKTFQETSYVKPLETAQTLSLEPNIADSESFTLTDIAKLFETQNTETQTPTPMPAIAKEATESLSVQSELPQNEMWATVKSTDQLSENILSNTEKTNTMMENLYQLFAGFVQNSSMNGGNQQQPMPIPVPTGGSGQNITSNDYPPDAIRTKGQGIIPMIRSKFA